MGSLTNVEGDLDTHNTKTVIVIKAKKAGVSVHALILAQKPDYIEDLLKLAPKIQADDRRRLEMLPVTPHVTGNTLQALPEPGSFYLQTGLLFAGAVLGGYLLKQFHRRYQSWQKPRRDSSGFPAGFPYRLPGP